MAWKVTNITNEIQTAKRIVERDGLVRLVYGIYPVDMSFYAEDGQLVEKEFGISTGLTEVARIKEKVGIHTLKPGESVVTKTKPVPDPRLRIEIVEEKGKIKTSLKDE